MDTNNVLQRFAQLSGLSPLDIQSYLQLANDCTAEISARFLPGCDAQSSSALLESAAAALLFYRYKVICRANRGADSFKAGDVQADIGDGGVAAALELYKQAVAACAGLLADGEFVFGRVDALCTEN